MEPQVFVPIVSSLTAPISLVVAFKSFQYGKRAKLMDVHIKFQNDMRALQKLLPADVNKPDWIPATDEHDRVLYLYWYLVFDEWMVCKKSNYGLDTLWDQFYANGVMSALRMAAFKKKLEKLLEGESSFLGLGREFRDDINDLCHKANGVGLALKSM
jgi:hypothetical protein